MTNYKLHIINYILRITNYKLSVGDVGVPSFKLNQTEKSLFILILQTSKISCKLHLKKISGEHKVFVA